MKLKMKTIFVPAVALAAAINLSPAFAHDHREGLDSDRAFDRASDQRSDRAFDRASDQASDRRRGNPRQRLNRIFNALDTDENGVITLDEMMAKALEKAEGKFDRIDTDDDGLISLEEFLAVSGRRGSDDIDRPEIDRDAVRACVADALGEDEAERPDRETRFTELDVNGDGFIDFDEFTDGVEEKVTTKFNNIDADADGGITIEELAAAMMSRRDIREVKRDCIDEQRETDDLIG